MAEKDCTEVGLAEKIQTRSGEENEKLDMQKGKMRFIEVETKNRTADFINRLLTVWESSVRATHLFLSDSEIKKIKEYVPQALAGIAHLMIAEDDRGCPGAFMGIKDGTLEMLFIFPGRKRKGARKAPAPIWD